MTKNNVFGKSTNYQRAKFISRVHDVIMLEHESVFKPTDRHIFFRNVLLKKNNSYKNNIYELATIQLFQVRIE